MLPIDVSIHKVPARLSPTAEFDRDPLSNPQVQLFKGVPEERTWNLTMIILSRDNNDLLLQLSWINILFTSPSLRDPGLPRGQLSPLSNASPRTRRWFHLFLDSCHHHPPAQLLSYPPISYNATPWSTSRVAFRAIPSF